MRRCYYISRSYDGKFCRRARWQNMLFTPRRVPPLRGRKIGKESRAGRAEGGFEWNGYITPTRKRWTFPPSRPFNLGSMARASMELRVRSAGSGLMICDQRTRSKLRVLICSPCGELVCTVLASLSADTWKCRTRLLPTSAATKARSRWWRNSVAVLI